MTGYNGRVGTTARRDKSLKASKVVTVSHRGRVVVSRFTRRDMGWLGEAVHGFIGLVSMALSSGSDPSFIPIVPLASAFEENKN